MSDDPLVGFIQAFLSMAPTIGMVPEMNPIHKIEDVTSVLWYRKKPFQVQMFIVPPNYIIPEHTHPNVDSFEVMLGGQISFSKNGKWVAEKDLAFQPKSQSMPNLAPRRGACIRVLPNDLHGGAFGPSGGVFMSVQHWLNDTDPHCVSADYDGKTMGDHHHSMVKFGEAVSKGGQENLTWKDAAYLEEEPPEFLTH